MGYSESDPERRSRRATPCRHDVRARSARPAERAASLTRQLLAFSRQQVLQPQVLDLNALVGNLDTMLRRLIGEDIELDACSWTPTLGACRPTRARSSRCIMNLAVNARDAMPQGGRAHHRDRAR